MDRQPHDYAAAMVYAQQQQIAANVQQQQPFGFHPQPQQFPQQMHHPSFVPHLSQQFRHLPPPQQLRPAPHHLPFHLQQQQHQQQPPPFQPHLPPHLLPPPYLQPFESAPTPPVAPPSDSELHKRIDKLVEYASKNGPEFELMIREKQKDNPEYAFLFGAEGHNYYRYKLWLSTHSSGTAFSSSYPHPSMSAISHPHNVMVNSLNAGVGGVPPSMYSGSQMHQPPPQPFYDHQIQQHSLPFMGQPRSDYESPVRPFKGLAGPLPSDVAAELNTVLNNLNGSKESIKGAKTWFMQRSPFAPALAEALRDRVFNLEDSDRQMHIIYLANDILFDSLQRRASPHDLDNEALAFRPVLGSMLARIYSNPHNKDANQSRLQKILQFWTSNEVYDADSTKLLEGEMMGGPAPPGHSKDFSTDPSVFQQMSPNLIHWQLDNQRSHAGSLDPDQHEKQASLATPGTSSSSQMGSSLSHPFSRNASTSNIYPPMNSTPLTVTVQTVPSSQPASTANVGDQPVPPYPLFPPGLIPGMVRKMQIGSGVPYSPLSPLDIPTVIPPTTASPSEILERVSKFFKEIGEVNPSEGPMKSPGSNDDDYEYEREPPVRKGGACIPPPSNLQVDPDTGTYPDGTVERKPGSSTSGRLGLGATANPNEVSQYDDVYSSYRKQRSTNYHSSMSARSAAR